MTGTSRISRWQSIVVAFSMVAALVVITPHEIARAATRSVPSQYATIQAAVSAAQNGDVIEVAPGTYTENIFIGSQTLTIRSTDGAAVTTIQSPGPDASIITVNTGVLTLDGFTVTGADIPTFANGGAVMVDNVAGTANVVNSIITGNSTGARGGGIASFGTLTVVDSIVAGNSSSRPGTTAGNGGGIFNSGSATIVRSTIESNSAYNGGGIYNATFGNPTLVVVDSTIQNNVAVSRGGGIAVESGTAQITGSLVAGNEGPTGAGVLVAGTGAAGVDVQITNSTIANNIGVGVLANSSADANLSFVTVSGNDLGIAGSQTNSIVLARALVAGNTTDCIGTAGLAAFNLIGAQPAGCTLTTVGTGDQVGTTADPIDPLLGPLADNGGPTQTLALLPGSPAIDGANNLICPSTDQRGAGFTRPQGLTCDIGAFEAQTASLQALIDATPSGGTVQIPPGTYNETIVVGSGKSLVGQGATASETVIDGSGLGTSTVTLDSDAAFENLTITGGSAGTSGGNILNDSADLTLTDVIVSNGTAQSGANIAAGGGATVTIVDSTISGGQASSGGGGISIASGSDLQVTGSVFSDNSAASGNGGGIAAFSSTVTIDASTLINNSAGSGAGRGGAVYADENSSVDIVDSALENNAAGLGGGAYAAGPMVVAQSLFNANAATFPDGSSGGGIGGTGTISVVNSTFQANTSAGNGGAIGIISGVATLNNVTITENVADVAGGAFSGDPGATIRIGNSLSAGNTNNGGGPDCSNFLFESLGHNVFESATIGSFCARQGTDIVAGVNAAPEALADNGGPTLTRALGADHPAVDAGGIDLGYPLFDASNSGDWQLNGSANIQEGELVLAGPAGSARGSAFLLDAVPVNQNFVATFQFRIDPFPGSNPPDGADGITFTITDSPDALGDGAGGFLGLSDGWNGASHVGSINGISIEFDTWVNNDAEGANDSTVLDTSVPGSAARNHIGIDIDGDVSSVASVEAPADLDDGSVWTAWVEYFEPNGETNAILDVYASNTGVKPVTPTLTYEFDPMDGASTDLFTRFDTTEAYVGFTGATGLQNISGTQHVLSFDFVSGPQCEATDQRGVIRPQGAQCDVGAFELEVTPAGTVLSELEVNTFEDTTLESGFSVELGAIPSDRLLAGASAIVGAPLGAIELDAPVDAAPLGAIGLDATPLGAIPLGAIPLGAIPLGAIPLGAINLMDLPIDGGWEAVLAGTTLEGRPPQTVTIEEVFDQVPADQLAEVRLAQLDPTSSAFGDVSVGSLLLGTVPISDLDTDTTLLAACADVSGGTCPTDASPLSLELTGSSLAASPLGAIPLGAIPLGAIPLGAIGTEAAPLGAIPLGAIPLGAIPLGAIGDIQSAPLGAIPLGAIGDLAAAPLGAIPLGAINVSAAPLGAIPLGAIPLGAIPLGAIPLGAIPLGAIPLGAIDVGEAFCAFHDGAADAGESCADLGIDPSTTTVSEYVSLLDVTDVQATPLGAIPLGAIPLGAIPLGAIDLAGVPLGAIPLGAIADLEASPLGAITLGLIDDYGLLAVDPASVCLGCSADTTLAQSIDLNGGAVPAPLGAIELDALPLGAIPLGAIELDPSSLDTITIAGVPLGAIPLGAIDLQTSPLGAIPLGAIGSVVIDSSTTATTLAEALPLGAIDPNASLFDIAGALTGFVLADVLDHLTIAFLGVDGLEAFDGLTLADVLVGILLASDFPWEDLPLDEIEVRDIACAAVPFDPEESGEISSICTGDVDTLDVGVSFLLESGDLGGVETRVTIPTDWAYLEESAWLDTGTGLIDLEPTVDGSDLVFMLPDTGASGGSNISLRFSVYAGYQLGTGTISALVTGQDSPDLNATSPTIDVVDGLEPSSLGAPTGIDDDTLYVGYVDSPTDVDGFSIPSAGEGFRTTVFLSNLDQDVDTFIYRPKAAPLSGDGSERAIPLGSTPVSDGIDFGGNTQLEPEVQGDSPVAASTGEILADSSTNTGTGGEELSILDADGETYTIQVAGFQGTSSDRPYTLRVKRTAEAAEPNTCSPREAPAYTALSGGGASIDPTTVTLFLTNPVRFDDIYGAGSWNTASAQLAALAARPEVGGQIVDIADIDGVAAAFAAWDANPCDVSAANDIVGAIQAWIQTSPPDSLRHVTIIGADEVVPFARAEDETVVANESTYASDFDASPLFSALTTRHYLTDAPYGDFDPIPWVGTKYAYVTDLSVGRLVENATHIAGAIQTYIDNNGVLSPTTAAVASYDFLYDGATLLADRLDLQLGGPVTDRSLMDDPAVVTAATAWTNTDLQSLIDGAPDIISPNSHYDHYRLLPSQENLNETENDLFTIGDLPGDLSDVIIFTMGCHSGLNVDGSIGTAVEDQDWPEVYSALNAIYIGNTGYGYGDSATVALTESIMANLAGNLDGTLTIGQALTQAKQDQFSKAGLYGVYDLKSIEEATLYGLPFWQIDVPGGGPVADPDPTAGPTGTDPLSGLAAASFSIAPDFELVNSVNGAYYAVDGETEYLQWRPIQPRTGVDVTKDGLIATGAIFTDLVTSDNPITDAAFARPMTVSSTQREPEVETPGIVFPTGFTTVGTGNRVNPNPTGPAVEQVQRLNLIPGQFQGNATGSGGVQRLFEEIDGTVFYQPVANLGSIDWTRPFISNVDATTSGSQVQFTVDTNDPDSGISRVTVLYRSGATAWTSVNLTQQGASDTWIGGGLFGTVTPPLDYFVFSVNDFGVTSVSTFKGGLYVTKAGPPPPTGDPITITGAPGLVPGVYASAVTISGPAGATATVDGGLPTLLPVAVGGNGRHIVAVTGGPTFNFVVDQDAPSASAIGNPSKFSPNEVATTPFECSDPTTLITSCTAEILTPDDSLVDVDFGETIPTSVRGVYSMMVTAVDSAGNTTTESFEYIVGLITSITGPLAPIEVNQPLNVTVQFLDAYSTSHEVSFEWGDGSVDTDLGATSPATGSHTYATTGVYTVTVTVTDSEGFSDTDDFQFIVVYDPNGGFVTGGGWIDSPAGAYTPDPALTGKATFGFVSKYKKGQSTPSGNTTFQFKTADFKFQSTSYDWLVITGGGRAQYKGSGAINGSGDYGFMLTAIDAAVSPSTNDDLFRIKIWEKNADGSEGTVIYDNKLGAPNGDDPDTALGGGSIVIHDGKKR